jgi:outer membrane protein assembly factor BamB
MRFDLTTEKYHELGRPSPGSYIQATAYDQARQLMYSFTLPALGFTVTDLKTGKTRWNVPLESIVHVPVIDPAGGVWGTYSIWDHAFFRYDPDRDAFEFPDGCVMSTARQAANIMYVGGGPVDCMVNGPDGMLYVGSAMGEIYRLDPATKAVTYLVRPLPFNRLPGLVFGPDGRLFGVCGDAWHVTLFAYDVNAGTDELICELKADNRVCFRPHDLAYQDGRFFIGETDNPKNSGCLWAITL